MKTGRYSRFTLVPAFDVDVFAKEAAVQTVIPPSYKQPAWTWPSGTTIPVLHVRPHQIPPGEIGHRAMFLLLHVDGVSTLEAIVASSGIGRDEVVAIFAGLVGLGYVAFDATPRESGVRELGAAAPSHAGRTAEADEASSGEGPQR